MAPRTFDLLLLAASVFAADFAALAGVEPSASDLGADWVAGPSVRRAGQRSRLLALGARRSSSELLGFLTGDRFAFDFVYRERKLPKQPGLGLGHGVEADRGPASLRRARLADRSDRGPDRHRPTAVLLVTHCSATKTMQSPDRARARACSELFPKRVLWVPARGHLIGVKARETTQRSRSFLYGALGYAAASLVGALAGQLLRERHRQREPPDQSAGRRHDGDAHDPSAVPASAAATCSRRWPTGRSSSTTPTPG